MSHGPEEVAAGDETRWSWTLLLTWIACFLPLLLIRFCIMLNDFVIVSCCFLFWPIKAHCWFLEVVNKIITFYLMFWLPLWHYSPWATSLLLSVLYITLHWSKHRVKLLPCLEPISIWIYPGLALQLLVICVKPLNHREFHLLGLDLIS